MRHHNFRQYSGVADERRFLRTIKRALSVLLFAGLIAVNLSAAPVIQFQVSDLGVNGSGQELFRYNYLLSGIDLLTNQEIDIRFSPSVFGQLSNGVAGPGFDLALFQPNQPVGTTGDYSALALVNHPPITGTFSVNVALLAGASVPASQPFFIFDDNVFPSTTLFSGSTTPVAVVGTPAPEPGGFWLSGLVLLIASGGYVARRRLAQAFQETV
jgi:hypothetical protein